MGNRNQKPQQNPELRDHLVDQQQEETFTCEICIEPVTLPNKFINNDKCVHFFCIDCMIKYIEATLEDNVSGIRCPATTCNQSLDPFACRHKITQQVFDKWCDVLCESTVLGVNSWVYCPNRECSELILNECGDRNLKRCVCPHCKKPFCFGCKVPWHAGSTCGEMIDENDAAFDVLRASNNWRRCPKCGHCVERDGGCSVIHCRCGTIFCYKCGKESKDICFHEGGLEVSICMIITLVSVALFIVGLINGFGF